MRVLASISVLSLLAVSASAQDEVPNPSFENYIMCPVTLGQLDLAAPWGAATIGTPDLFNTCHTGPFVGVPVNGIGTQAPYSGDGYAGILALYGHPDFPDYREYMQTPLACSTLGVGKTYRFEMHLSLAEDSSAATDRIGAYFSSTPISSADFFPLPVTPHLETPAGVFLDDTTDWMKFSKTFVAAGGESYLTIGNFHGVADSAQIPAGFGPTPDLFFDDTAYYYIDVVSIQCEPCLEPPLGMVAWWPLDETSGPLSMDIVGALHGVQEDSPAPIAGLVDMSLDFMASGVAVPTAPEIEVGTGDFTVDLWVRPEGSSMQTLFAKIPVLPTGPGYGLAVNADNTLTFTMIDASLNMVTFDTTEALEASVWSLVAVSVDRDDPAGGRIYIDGIPEAFDPTPASGSLTNALPLRFARDGGAGVGADFLGGLDEIEFFNSVLDSADVMSIHDALSSGKCKVFVELPPPVVVPVIGVAVVVGELVNDSPSVGTFGVSVQGDPIHTQYGGRRTNVPGPMNPVVVSPQPIQVAAGERVPVEFRMDVPRGLGPGKRASYTVRTTHLETGRTFISRGILTGRQPGSLRPR